jgi:hypothetical protein
MKKLLVLSSERRNKANQAMEEEKTSHKKMDPEAENGWSDGIYENGAGERDTARHDALIYRTARRESYT